MIRKRSLILVTLLYLCLVWALPGAAAMETYTLEKTVDVDFGTIWCVPVYDGQDLVVSTEYDGYIYLGRYDQDLARQGEAVRVVESGDLPAGEHVADHKHIFQNDYHYITFSISGEGSGGNLYLLKLDRDFNRVNLITVVEDDAPTNDMLLVGDGEYIYVGKFMPGRGHRIYKYDADLNLQGTYEIGGGPFQHSNGAVALYHDEHFYLVAPATLAPGENDQFYLLVFDRDWLPSQDRRTILEDEGMLSLVTALYYRDGVGNFVIHYARMSDDQGGPIYRAVYDQDWNLLENVLVLEGAYNRPHAVVVDDHLFLGYDGDRLGLSRFSISR